MSKTQTILTHGRLVLAVAAAAAAAATSAGSSESSLSCAGGAVTLHPRRA